MTLSDLLETFNWSQFINVNIERKYVLLNGDFFTVADFAMDPSLLFTPVKSFSWHDGFLEVVS